MTKKKIEVELLTQEYALKDKSLPPIKIYATINKGETITLKTNKNQEAFHFIKSQPKIARGVIALMQEALKLLPKEGR